MQRHARPLWPGHCQRYDLFSATRGHIMRPPSGQSLRPLPALFSSAVPLSATPGYISCLSVWSSGQGQRSISRQMSTALVGESYNSVSRQTKMSFLSSSQGPRPLSANHTIQRHVRLKYPSDLQDKIHDPFKARSRHCCAMLT